MRRSEGIQRDTPGIFSARSGLGFLICLESANNPQLHSNVPEAPMQPRLLVISGSLTGTVRPLIDGYPSISLDESNQLQLIDNAASCEHCAIEHVGGQYEVIDRDSLGGTFVNGIPVKRKVLDHGDMIRVGKSELEFRLHEGEKAGTSQTLLSDAPSASSLLSISVEHSAAPPTFADQVCSMARGWAALFRLTSIINSIRDSELLQREFLRLLCEVIPAESGAVVLLHNLDEY